MKYRARLVGKGGDLDSIEANDLTELRHMIAFMLGGANEWLLSPGDSIVIEEAE